MVKNQLFLIQSLYKHKRTMADPIAEFIHWYRRRPIVTKIFLTLSTLIAILLSFGLISIDSLYYMFENTYPTLQLWRPLTSLLFISQLNLYFIAKAYLVYKALVTAESDIFKEEEIADFWLLLIYIFTMLSIFGAVVNVYFLSDGFVMALVYVWSRYKPFRNMVLIFQIQISSGVYPWVYLGFAILIGQSLYITLAGLIIGYLYTYLKNQFVGRFNIDLLKTPSILKSLGKVYNERRGINEQQVFEERQMNQDERAQ